MRAKTKIAVMFTTAALALAVGVVASAQNLNVKGQVVGEGQSGLPHYFLGNVGIGTTAPAAKLDVAGEIRGSASIVSTSADPYFRTNADNKYIVLSGGSGWASTGATMVLRGASHPNNPHGLEIFTGNAERVRVVSNGNVGIGTRAPYYRLHTIGDVYADGGWLRSSGATGWYNESYGGGWHMSDGTWIRSYGGKPVYIDTTLATAGSVGVGTTGPAHKLDVQGGHIRTSNSLLVGNQDQAADLAQGIYWGDWFYGIYREPGAWVHPYPDLKVQFHTGVKVRAHGGFGGVSIWEDWCDNQMDTCSYGGSGAGTELARFRSNVWGGTTVSSNLTVSGQLAAPGNARVDVYQCPVQAATGCGGGSWGSYGCQGQVSTQATCRTVEWPNQCTFNCTYLGKMLIVP